MESIQIWGPILKMWHDVERTECEWAAKSWKSARSGGPRLRIVIALMLAGF